MVFANSLVREVAVPVGRPGIAEDANDGKEKLTSSDEFDGVASIDGRTVRRLFR